MNLMQNRFGENFPTMFNPARHTVVIAGRPAQATSDGHLVMCLQPCTSYHSFENMLAFLSFLLGVLLASRACALPDDMEIFSFGELSATDKWCTFASFFFPVAPV